MKKFSNATLAAAQHPRSLARIVLAFVASILVVLLAMMGMAAGPNGDLVFAQEESPSPTEPSTGPAIKLLNPSQAYDPGFALPPRPPETPDPPNLSDKYDGHDRAYHVVAVTRQAPAGAVVEAEWQPSDGSNAVTVGLLQQVAGSNDTWEYFWEIPDGLSGGGTFVVRLFRPSGGTFEEIAKDETAARINQAEETVEIEWPSQNGQLGFHKPKGGFWRGVVEGTASGDNLRILVYYSTSRPGEEVKYTQCARVRLGSSNSEDEGTRPWAASCALAGKDLPSMVTAIAAVGVEDDKAAVVTTAEFTQESADAHRVHGYMQRVEQMKVELQGIDRAGTAAYPSGRRRVAMQPRGTTSPNAPNGCLTFDALITDHLDRPVQGANVDVHIQGPNDQIGFGSDDNDGTGSDDSTYKAPDKGSHSKESGRRCSDYEDTPWDDRGEPAEEQGEHNVPGGPDIKHIESGPGSGLDAASADVAFKFVPGAFRFLVYSADPGFTTIRAWVDDEPITNETQTREADDDLPGQAPSATLQAQWLPEPMTISMSPRADSATVGSCNRYIVRARAGNAVVPNFNVDVHAAGPTNDLDFCDPGDGSPRRAPDQPEGDDAHQPEDEGEASHKSDSPDNPEVQHTEGETDANGNFIIGITSTTLGATELTAWGDGERDGPGNEDNDVRGSSEPSGTASKNWAGSAQDAEVRFVNPSGYGGAGDNVSRIRDADELYHLVARVDLPDVVEGVEFFLMDGETIFRDLGDATRVGTTDTWELFWDVSVPDGTYTIRAQIINTQKREDRTIRVRNENSATDPRVVAFQTAELTRPPNGAGAPFSEGETTIAGVASADAEGVEFYYTKTDARETRNSAQWILCGESELATGDAPQNFEGKCALQDSDAALDVTGIAALAYICDMVTGCQEFGVGRIRHSGDAHRVFGFEANPSVTIEPAQASSETGKCRRFELTVTDAVGRAIPRANVDVHLTGPTDGAEFCDVTDSSPRRAPTTGGHSASAEDGEAADHQKTGADTHHTEGQANEGGKFIFGIRSTAAGDSQILGWADQNDNDNLDADEKSGSAVMRWGGGGGGGGRTCTHRGDAGDNTIVGTPGDDVICAGRGKDVIRGRGGNDIIRGGRGNDDIRGNAGRDTMYGGRGIDVIRGGRGADVARGHSGNDTLRGFTGKDRLFGGDDDDVISGGDHNDYLRGNRGRDLISGGAGRDNCRGGRGRDSITRCE